jgi:hypothetical protein
MDIKFSSGKNFDVFWALIFNVHGNNKNDLKNNSSSI